MSEITVYLLKSPINCGHVTSYNETKRNLNSKHGLFHWKITSDSLYESAKKHKRRKKNAINL